MMIDDIQGILSGEIELAEASLKEFLKNNGGLFSFGELHEGDTYSQLWQNLCKFIVNPKADRIHIDVLNTIRILSRDKNGLDDVISTELINTLLDFAGIKIGEFCAGKHLSLALESQKCLCNIVFNTSVAAEMCRTNGALEGIVERLKQVTYLFEPNELLFFDMKLLFIVTALNSQSRTVLRDDLDGIEYIVNALSNVLTRYVFTLPELPRSIICEMIKALFNITVNGMDASDDATNTKCVNIMHVLWPLLLLECEKNDSRHELTNHIVNLLTNMPNSAFVHLYAPIYPDDDDSCKPEEYFQNHNMQAVYEIVQFLERALNKEPSVSQQHENLSPVFVVLLRAASAERPIRKYLRNKILPPLKDVHHRPEEGNSLRNYICRLLTTPITEVRDLAAEFLFVLCKENVNRMVKYTGYGNAAGLLARRGLLGGSGAASTSKYSSDSEDSDTEEYKELKHGINPVLGCYEPPRPNPTADMTEEQKEHEAMKLVALMDRMSKTGIIKPCKVGADGHASVVDYISAMREANNNERICDSSDSD